MNMRSTRMLAIVAAALLLGVFLLNTVDNDYEAQDAGLLLPDLKAKLNDVDSVTIESGGTDAASVTIRRDGDRWTVATRDGYPADLGKLREGLLALADAERLEAKTADPARHEQLGLAGDDATRLALSGEGIDVAVILGDVAQRSYRYVRLDGEDQSWLIDANPDLPAEPGDWLLTDLLDIDSDDIAEVTITHAGGDTLRITRGEEAAEFVVEDIPEGRELRYASIVNPIPGALNGLALEDVRAATDDDPEPDATTVFRGSDGLDVTVTRREIDGESWFAISAAAAATEAAAEEAAGAADEAAEAEDAADGSDEQAADESADDAVDPAARAAEINATAEGWLFRLPSYKADALARTWDDILAPLDEDGDAE